MNRQWFSVGVIVVLLLGLIGIGWLNRNNLVMVEVGSTAPDYEAVDLDGSAVRISDLRGEVVLLNVWATWCPPCKEEMPSMQRLHNDLGPGGLRIIAVSVDADLGIMDRVGNRGGDVDAFTRELGLTFPIWRDPAGGIRQAYWVRALPETFAINREGEIVKKWLGEVDWDSDAPRNLLERLLATPQPLTVKVSH